MNCRVVLDDGCGFPIYARERHFAMAILALVPRVAMRIWAMGGVSEGGVLNLVNGSWVQFMAGCMGGGAQKTRNDPP